MEYDEQVSARLHMSLDEIIGQEQLDGSAQIKRRRPKGVFPGTASSPPPTTSASPTGLPPLLQTEPDGRFAAAFPPDIGDPSWFPSRPAPSARPLPPLIRGPGRLPGVLPFGVGARPPFSLPPGHPRMDLRWPRQRHLAGGYLVASNGVQPPPPPLGAAPVITAPRPFSVPPRPSAAAELEYLPRRPVVGPYDEPVQAGALRPGWKRSRYLDGVRGHNGSPSPHHPLGYHGAAPALAGGLSPSLVEDTNGSVHTQTPYAYGASCPAPAYGSRPSAEFFESMYPRETGMDQGRVVGMSGEGLLSPRTSRRGPPDAPENLATRQMPPDQCTKPPGFRSFSLREGDSAMGNASSGACLGSRREFTVIVSNVPKDLPAVEIQEAFSCMGTVLRTDIMLNSKGEHTGRVCIAYASAEAAKAAVAQFDEGDLNGNTIRVFAE